MSLYTISNEMRITYRLLSVISDMMPSALWEYTDKVSQLYISDSLALDDGRDVILTMEALDIRLFMNVITDFTTVLLFLLRGNNGFSAS